MRYTTETGDLGAFIQYALEGFRDGLENIIKVIHRDQTELTWNNFVHDTIESMERKNNETQRRLRQLAYHIPADRFCSPDEIKTLNPQIAGRYMRLSPVTLRRDLDILVKTNILKAEKGRFRANHEILRSFLPETSVPIRRHY